MSGAVMAGLEALAWLFAASQAAAWIRKGAPVVAFLLGGVILVPLSALDDDDDEDELILVDGPVLAFDEEDDPSGELVFDDDVETVRSEAARLTTQLETAARRMAALEARRAALIRRLEDSGR